MADISVTAANVGLAENGVGTRQVQVGETVTQGEPLYLKTSDNKYWLADADAAASAVVAGIALTPAAADGYVVMATSGAVDVGGTLTVGETYIVSATACGIAPIGDLASGDYLSILGVATATDTLDINLYISGVAKP